MLVIFHFCRVGVFDQLKFTFFGPFEWLFGLGIGEFELCNLKKNQYYCLQVFQGGVLNLGFAQYISFIYITRPLWFLSFTGTGKLLMASSKQ